MKSTLPSTSRKDSGSCRDRIGALRPVMSLTNEFVFCSTHSPASNCHHMLLQVNVFCVMSSFHHSVRCGLLCEFKLFRIKVLTDVSEPPIDSIFKALGAIFKA